ncbi:hypothetical protein FHR32_005225 [Streptosporangium album]|uniref:Uncharacterized protein n=1 Tax=Streptosporangium album TaxID=47479 RepID=A0A7W7RYZ8_9ACTN|nr:hypothetical protein [Streptosporangium album]
MPFPPSVTEELDPVSVPWPDPGAAATGTRVPT